MSAERYIELLQMLITMTDPRNQEEVLHATNILKELLELAKSSGKVKGFTLHMMHQGYFEFPFLLDRKEEFAGKPGDYDTNRAKRQRLAMLLRPGC